MLRAVIARDPQEKPCYSWYPWTKTQLGEHGFDVQEPAMPETKPPNLRPWVQTLAETIGRPDNELYLIGHSLGCMAVLRYLEVLRKGPNVGGVVLVAGLTDTLSIAELFAFLEAPVDVATVRSRITQGAIILNSANDPYGLQHYGKKLKDEVAGESVVLSRLPSGPANNSESYMHLPAVMAAVRKLSGKEKPYGTIFV